MTNICIGCGMCCDGTMFGSVCLSDGDSADQLRSSGIEVTVAGDTTSFGQPCAAFRSGQCMVYEQRPSVCQGYRCLLLRRFEANEVSRSEALALIAQTMALRDRVRSALTAWVETKDMLSLGNLYRLMLEELDTMEDQPTARRENAELLMEVAALRAILAREFEPRESPSHPPDTFEPNAT